MTRRNSGIPAEQLEDVSFLRGGRSPYTFSFINCISLFHYWEKLHNADQVKGIGKQNCSLHHKPQTQPTGSKFIHPQTWPLLPDATTRWQYYFEKGPLQCLSGVY